MSNQISKYGLQWPEGTTELSIELEMIKRGGSWQGTQGQTIGLGLYQHHRNAQTIIWPEDDWHRWAVLALQEITENDITTLMGPSDAGKTYPASKWGLVEYWASPDNTLVLVSSTDVRGLELRVWGTMKDLFNRALDRFPELAGEPLESLHCITTDSLDEDDGRARVLKKGVICIPCLQSGRYVGLGKYVGIKQKRLRQIADEVQLMGISFLDALANYLGKDYQGVFLGNPLDPLDPLGKIAEPLEGWAAQKEPEKTESWNTRFTVEGAECKGRCVNFVGTDSPNFDPETKDLYPYMLGSRKIEAVKAFWGEDSLQYYSQCKGVMKSGLLAHRVITRDLCRLHNAASSFYWSGGTIIRIYAVDAAYRGEGGDRCIGGYIEFGTDVEGIQKIKVIPPKVIPVNLRLEKEAEDQIAEYVFADCQELGIPATAIFYDSTGRGTLGSAFARVFGHTTPVPVEFGGAATKRPVRDDLYVLEGPPGKEVRRLKRCEEHYCKFVTELWFSVRYVIECDQMHGLPETVMNEGCIREYGVTTGNRIELESKVDTKKRMGRSPDEFDWLATAIEGARRLGFKIRKLGDVGSHTEDSSKWLDERRSKINKLMKSKQLTRR
jgi:hypothetical protein